MDHAGKDVGFEVDKVTGLALMEGCDLPGVGNDGNTEAAGGVGVDDGEADAVECDGAFIDEKGCEFFRGLESEEVRCLAGLDGEESGCIVNVTLDDMAVEVCGGGHGAFDIDASAGDEGSQSGDLAGFFHDIGEHDFAFFAHDGETDPADSDAGASGGDVKRETDGEPWPAGGLDFAGAFNDACKHSGMISLFGQTPRC